LDAGRPARRRSDRRLRSTRGTVHRAVGQEHVQLRAADPGLVVAAARPAREAAMNRRGVVLLSLLLLALLVLPAFANPYVLSVVTLILFFAFTGQAWNVMMGFAGQLSLGHSLYVGVGAYVAAGLYVLYGIGPWAGLWAAMVACALLGATIGALAFRFRIAGVY